VRKWMQRMRQHPNGNLPSQSACIYRALELLIHTQALAEVFEVRRMADSRPTKYEQATQQNRAQ
jgi:hypothetical protein